MKPPLNRHHTPLDHEAEMLTREKNTKRIRTKRHQLARVRLQGRALQTQHQQLQQLLREHKLARETLRGMMNHYHEQPDEWEVQMVRWRELAHTCFQLRTVEQCLAELNAAMIEATRFAASQNKVTTGLSFMGWQESRRIDPTTSFASVQFPQDVSRHRLGLPDPRVLAWLHRERVVQQVHQTDICCLYRGDARNRPLVCESMAVRVLQSRPFKVTEMYHRPPERNSERL